jgi:hypothetical protein
MTGRTRAPSPRFEARMIGVLSLLTILTGVSAQLFVSNRLVVFDDAAATAANIVAHRSLFRLGFTVYLVEMACNIAVTALFYDLLKPAGRSVSLVMAFLGLAGCSIKTLSRLFYVAPLFLLDGPQHPALLDPGQSQALALLLLELNGQGAGMALPFFGFAAILQGYLIVRSTYLPRILGVLSALAGAGWLTFLSPPLGARLFPYVAAFALVVSAAVILWLLVFGVDEDRWKEQARTAREW